MKKKVKDRLKVIDKTMKITEIDRFMMSAGEQHIANRLGIIIGLLTILIDEVDL